MKKKIMVMVMVLLVAVCGSRIYYVNTRPYLQHLPEKIVYGLGERVALADGEYYYTSQNIDGYHIQVRESEVVCVDELLGQYGETRDYFTRLNTECKWDYVYLVSVSIDYDSKEDPTDKILNLCEFKLVGPDYYMNFSEEINMLAGFNEMLGGNDMISITSGKPVDITLPYLIDTKTEHALSLHYLEKSNPKLIVSYYPQEVYLEIK